MTELPTGWAVARVEGLVADNGITDGPFGSNLKTAHYRDSGPRVIRLQNVGDGVFRDERAHIEQDHYERLLKHAVLPGDVLIASLGETLPRACQAPDIGAAIVKADVIRARTAAGVSSAYLMWALNSPQIRERVANQIKGVGRPRFSLGGLRALEIPLAPTAEQGRIVAAIEEAFSLLDAGETALHNTRTRLKRLRDAVLTAAVTGQLLPQDPTDTPSTGTTGRLVEQPTTEAARFPRLPNSWTIAPLGSLADLTLGKMLDAKSQTGDHPHEYLRNLNVRWFSFDLSAMAVMDVEPRDLERVTVRAGDLVVCEGGEPGRCAVWRGEPIVIQKALHRVRCNPDANSDFIALVLRWWSVRPDFGRFITGTTIKHLPKERLRTLPVPLPPIEEQARIVAEVERQFSFIEAAERAVETGLRRSSALRRSVLKAAFEGRLVAQDPGDEPAAVLLERIAAERAAAAPRTRRAPRRVRGEAK